MEGISGKRSLIVAGIPAFNEEKTIGRVVILTQKHVDRTVVCDDGSTDMTATIAERLGAEVISHETNLGKGGALRSIFENARKKNADILLTLDGDGQHNPEEIPRLIAPIQKGEADVVIGSRFLKDADAVPGYRRVGNKILNAMTASGVSDTQSGFRAYNSRAVNSITPAEMGMGVDSEILMEASKMGLRIVEVPVSVRYGHGKTSKTNPLTHTLDVASAVVKIASIRKPLQVFGLSGIILVVLGLYFLVHTIQVYMTYRTLDIITITDGAIAFSLAMAGLLTLFTGVILFTITSVVRKTED
jgi:glycosyltransferase involved in cell wall biosynthesis